MNTMEGIDKAKEVWSGVRGIYDIKIFMDGDVDVGGLKDDICTVVFFGSGGISSLNDLRRKYHGQTYLKYPFRLCGENNGEICLCDAEGNEGIDGYVVVSKRNIKFLYSEYRLAKEDDVKLFSRRLADEFVDRWNAVKRGFVFDCVVMEGDEECIVADIMTCENNKLRKTISDKVRFVGSDLEELISGIEVAVLD